ncbi:MAG: DUF4293 family protein [Bacteroidaceae bacterium]|nr:DUF4293 family protein [Bacteroidaceae bacterium]
MKFRFYQLYYVLAAVLLIVAMCSNLLYILAPDGATYTLGNFSLIKPDGSASYSVVALGVVLIVAVAVNLFGLFVSLFNNFELQKRSSILSVLLLTGYHILLLLYVLLVINSDDNLATINFAEAAVMFPFTAIVLNVLSFLSARRAEAKIIAKASGFRLRD